MSLVHIGSLVLGMENTCRDRGRFSIDCSIMQQQLTPLIYLIYSSTINGAYGSKYIDKVKNQGREVMVFEYDGLRNLEKEDLKEGCRKELYG